MGERAQQGLLHQIVGAMDVPHSEMAKARRLGTVAST